MAADEKKQHAEEKKYVQISREFTHLCADSVGLQNLDEEAAAILTEDVNYRLREAIQIAGQFMRHAKRKKLSSDDFIKALTWSDVDPIYGHGSLEPNPFHFLKEAEVFYVQDREINLVSIVNGSQLIEMPGECELKAQWLAIEGVQKEAPGTIPHGKKDGASTIGEDQMSYYDKVTKAILSNDEQLMKVALRDLRTDSKIPPLLPYFINFVCVGIKKVSHDPTQLYKLLHTVHSLTTNEYLYLGPQPFLKMLVQGVLYVIIEPLAASINPINDHWALRDYAAQILARIVRIWHTPVNQLLQHVLTSLEEVLKDLSRPFSSHYGAVVTLTVLGPLAIGKCVIPNLAHYWPHLETALNDCAYANAQVKADAHKVYGALLVASESFVLHLHRTLDHHGSPPAAEDTYANLYGHFGDSLSARLPYVTVPNFYHPKPDNLTGGLFVTAESTMTGEELLEAFEVREEEMQSYSGEDDHSDDDNSLMSDDAEVEHEKKVDLRIKSTVSDPALGIKLTIAKLPRNPEKPFPKKLSIKISKEQLQPQRPFECVPLRPRYPNVDLTFEGSMPVLPAMLRRKVFNVPNTADNSQFLRLHLKHRSFRARRALRAISGKLRLKRAFNTGNVLAIL